MWKLIVGFALFSGLAIWLLMQGGDGLDLSGENHVIEAHAPAASAAASGAPP